MLRIVSAMPTCRAQTVTMRKRRTINVGARKKIIHGTKSSIPTVAAPASLKPVAPNRWRTFWATQV